MKWNPSHLPALKKDMEQLLPKVARPVGTVRVDIHHAEQLRLSAICWEGDELRYSMLVDEPPSRGGDGSAPAPLSYFVLGAGACLMTQIAKLAILDNLDISSLSMSVRGHFDRVLRGSFTDIIYDIQMTGGESIGRVRRLCKEADEHCFASNTLRSSVRLVVNITYNGQKLPFDEGDQA
jgi:uncharacterized OsmC-like protein